MAKENINIYFRLKKKKNETKNYLLEEIRV